MREGEGKKYNPYPQPPHLYLDDRWYFMTGSNYHGHHHLKSDAAKIIVRDKLMALTQKYNWQLKAWVILNNHYHFLAKVRLGSDIRPFFQYLHGGTSFELNNLENKRGRKVWHNFWDRCIRNERGFWTRFNYIHNNPIKHGYVKRLSDWPYSSFHDYLRTEGRDWLADCWRNYPVISYLDGDDF